MKIINIAGFVVFFDKNKIYRLNLPPFEDFSIFLLKEEFKKLKTHSKNLKKFLSGLIAYFEGKKKNFNDINYEIKRVSKFVLDILNEVKKIPYGCVKRYYQIAQFCNTHPRAVGLALRLNPLPILIPCHRVISKNNQLRGFSWGLKWKEFLLSLEGWGGTYPPRPAFWRGTFLKKGSPIPPPKTSPPFKVRHEGRW